MYCGKNNIIATIVAFLLLAATGLHAEPTLNINNKTDHYLLANVLQYFVDDTAKKNLDDVLKSNDIWQTSNNDTINLSFTKAALWTKLNLHNDTAMQQDMLMVIAQPLLLNIDVYEEQVDGKWQIRLSGINPANVGNSIPHRYPNFSISLQPGQTKTVIYRVTASNLVFPLSIWKQEAFERNDHVDQYITGFYYGMLTAVGIYNFLMFFIVREKSHLYYVLSGLLYQRHGLY